MQALVVAFVFFFSGASSAPHVSVENCEFLIPSGYYVSSGSIRAPEVKLVPQDTSDVGSIRIKESVGVPRSSEKDGVRVRILEEYQFPSYRVFRVEHEFNGGAAESVESTVILVGGYSIQIIGNLKSRWDHYLVNCHDG